VGTVFSVNVTGFEVKEGVGAWLTSPSGQVLPFTMTSTPSGKDGTINNIQINSAGFAEGIWSFTVAGQSSGHQSRVSFQVGNPATATPVPAATNTPVPAATNTPAPGPTNTPAPGATNTPVPAATNTPAATPTRGPLTVNPTSGDPNTSFTFVGTGFQPNEQVAEWFVDPANTYWYPSSGANLTATATGQVSQVLVPANSFDTVVRGTWIFHLHGITSGVDESVQFTVR
jgi:hypothetical protein